MTRIKYDVQLMKAMAIFEKITHAKIHDCFEDQNGSIVFVVAPGELGRALGRGAENVRKLSELFKKKVKMVQYDQDLVKFVGHLIYPLRVQNIVLEDETLIIEGGDSKTKGLLIGRDFRNIKQTTSVVQRYFPIKDIKVI